MGHRSLIFGGLVGLIYRYNCSTKNLYISIALIELYDFENITWCPACVELRVVLSYVGL
jgi:hypothetical protein